MNTKIPAADRASTIMLATSGRSRFFCREKSAVISRMPNAGAQRRRVSEANEGTPSEARGVRWSAWLGVNTNNYFSS